MAGKQEGRSFFTETRREWSVVRKCTPLQAAWRLAEAWRKGGRSGPASEQKVVGWEKRLSKEPSYVVQIRVNKAGGEIRIRSVGMGRGWKGASILGPPGQGWRAEIKRWRSWDEKKKKRKRGTKLHSDPFLAGKVIIPRNSTELPNLILCHQVSVKFLSKVPHYPPAVHSWSYGLLLPSVTLGPEVGKAAVAALQSCWPLAGQMRHAS